MYHQLYFVAFVSLVAGQSNLLVKVDENKGDFQISLSGKVWFNSGPVWVRNNQQQLSTDDGTLVLTGHITQMGSDAMGHFTYDLFKWKTKDDTFHFNTYINVYKDVPVVVFGQQFADGVIKASLEQDNSTISAFPTILLEDQEELGYLTFYGGQIKTSKVDRWAPDVEIYHNDDGGYPLIVFDSSMKNTVVLSPFNTFMSASSTYWKSADNSYIGFGIISSVNEVPPGYDYETILVAGHNVTGTMSVWGDLLMKKYGKDTSYRDTDYSLNYLGYWTDNGACYYHSSGQYSNYEEMVVAMKEYADQQQIPFKYIQLDDWWYYWGKTNGVKNWTAMPQVFPNGIESVKNKTRWPIFAHNKYWDHDTDYAKQNKGPFSFIMDELNGMVGIPDEPQFWNYLLSNAKEKWGLIVYEQDFLLTTFQRVGQLRTELNLGRKWLKQMGDVAQDLDLRIQYCMAWTRNVLQSVEIPVVTQVRASSDYMPGSLQWSIGDSSILAYSVGLAPSKDNFHTSNTEDKCKFPTPEQNAELETISAVLSGSVVGPSDTVGNINKTLVMSTCMTDGRLLKPTRPGLALDSTFLYRAFGKGGPNGIVNIAYSEVSQFTWYYILAANLAESYQLKASELPSSRNLRPKTDYFYSVAFRYNLGGKVFKQVNITNSLSTISLVACGTSDFQYWVMAPVMQVFGMFTVILGELDKVIPFSHTRFTDVTAYNDMVVISMVGVPGETVSVSFMDALLQTVSTAKCVIQSDGTAILKGDLYNTFKC